MFMLFCASTSEVFTSSMLFFQVRIWDVNEGKCIKELEVLCKIL